MSMAELEKFPHFADAIVRDWSMANRSKYPWKNVLLILLGAQRAVSDFGPEKLLFELTTLLDVAYHHMRSES